MSNHRRFEPNYFSLAEAAWQTCQQSTRILSPLDWAYLASWEEAGIDVEAVVLGIVTTFENRAEFAPDAKPVKCLSYCAPEILARQEEINQQIAQGFDPRPGIRRRYFGENLYRIERRDLPVKCSPLATMRKVTPCKG